MRRLLTYLLGLGLTGALGAGCLDDIPNDCQTDADCGPGARCVREGVKVCVGGGEGGSGGDGGSGGAGGGGAGGTGGIGGSGGGSELLPIDLEPSIAAGAELAVFLKSHERPVRTFVVTVRIDGGQAQERRFVDPPGAGWALYGRDETNPLLFTVPLEVPAEARAIGVTIEAEAATAGGELALVAAGMATVELADQEAGRLAAEVDLALSTSFDFDGDGAPDAADCAPEDPGVYPGAVDVCDGVDTDCDPGGVCIVPLPEGHTVRDLACGAELCVAAVDGDEGPGFLYAVSTTGASELAPTAIITPSGVAVASEALGSPTLFVVDRTANRVRTFNSNGSSRAGAFVPSNVMGDAITISGRGTAGFVPYRDVPGVEYFSPSGIGGSLFEINCAPTALCKPVDLSELADASDTLSPTANPAHLAVRHTSSIANPQLYVIFDGDPRLGIAQVGRMSGTVQTNASGLVRLWEDKAPTALSVTPDETQLFVAGAGAEGHSSLAIIETGNDLASHGEPRFVSLLDSTCPASVASTEQAAYVTDCRGTVRVLPHRDDDNGERDVYNVRHCASLGKTVGRTTPGGDLVAVSCPGEPQFAILGAD